MGPRVLEARRVLIALAIYVALFIGWQVASVGSGASSLVTNLAFIPIGVAASLLGLRAARDRQLDARTRRAWAILTAAFTTFLFGDLTWMVFENVLGIEPFPSIADAFYLAFYPLVLWGFLAFPSARQDRSARLKFWLDAGTVLLAGWMLIWYFVIGPVAIDAAASPAQTVLSIAYPIGDLLVLFGIAAVLLRRPPATSRRSLVILAVGALLFVAADTAFSYLDFNEAYSSGDWPDTLWMLAQASFVYAAAAQTRRGSPALEPGLDDIDAPNVLSKLPYVAVAAGYTMLLVIARRQSIYPVGGLLVAAVGVAALVLVRQMTVLRDNARLVGELHALATTDSLTGLKTRRAFQELASHEFEIARRYQRDLSAIMLDVDHFKRVNDSFGHDIGDAVLCAVGDACRAQVRASDIIGRLGGDELVLVLPGTGIAAAALVADRIRCAIDARPIRVGDRLVPVTTSLGVADATTCGSLDELLRNADAALYEAKAEGRNRTHAQRSA